MVQATAERAQRPTTHVTCRMPASWPRRRPADQSDSWDFESTRRQTPLRSSPNGEAKDAAREVCQAAAGLPPGRHAIVAGGETTVTLAGDGRGGRNQELALAFALQAEQQKLAPSWALLSGGTDGIDGPTDAAGGVVDAETLLRIRRAGGDPEALLANNDAYRALQLSEDLLITGATGTNVADLLVVLIDSG